MASDSANVTVPPLIYVKDKEIMVNMENSHQTVIRLLEVIKKLEARIEALEN